MNENVVQHIMKTAWEKFSSNFLLLGTVSAGCYAITVIFQFSKAIINIHGYTL